MKKSRTSGPTLPHERTPKPLPCCVLCLEPLHPPLTSQTVEFVKGTGAVTYHQNCYKFVLYLRKTVASGNAVAVTTTGIITSKSA